MDENNNGDKPQENGGWQSVDSTPAAGNDGYIPPPPPVQTGGAPVAEKRNDTLGIIGLIAGILALILAICCWPLGIALAITALICGFIAKSKGQRFALAGIIMGIIAILLAIVFLVIWGAASQFLPDFLNELMYELEYY